MKCPHEPIAYHIGVIDNGLALTLRALQRQLTAIPCGQFDIRLIHAITRKPWPGQRLWSAEEILDLATTRFLRSANRQGFDVYFRPYAETRNSGYILLDLDDATPTAITSMRTHGHAPCLVVATSPGHQQAWIRISPHPLEPQAATHIAQCLARTYQADPASADWRHLGRLAGFTNQKPQRRQLNGLAPWVKVLYAQPCLASDPNLLSSLAHPIARHRLRALRKPPRPLAVDTTAAFLSSAQAAQIYQRILLQLRIPQRFPQPNWSIADKWIAKQLLSENFAAREVATVLRLASPGFPRAHSDPQDYLRRTLARARRELESSPFSARANDTLEHLPGTPIQPKLSL